MIPLDSQKKVLREPVTACEAQMPSCVLYNDCRSRDVCIYNVMWEYDIHTVTVRNFSTCKDF